MDLVTLQDWVYPVTASGVPPYAPDDGVGRHTHTAYSTPSPYQPNVYRPKDLVENYDSLVWREGFRVSGTFELKTYDIHKTLALLPKGTLVSLMDSDEVCVVTTHHIGTDEKGQDVLTVSGRNLLTHILDNRPTWAYESNPLNASGINSTRINLVFQIPDHLAFILWGGIVFPHAEGGYPTSHKPFELPENIIVPHTAISQSVETLGDHYRAEWPPPLETRLKSASDLLELDQRYGVRVIRPKDATAVIYKPKLNSLYGEYNPLIETANITKMLFDIYESRDLTVGNDRVMFRHDAGDITKAEYISSIEGAKTTVSAHFEFDPERFPVRPAMFCYPLWSDDIIFDDDGMLQPNPNADAHKYIAGVKFAMGEVASTAEIREEDGGLTEEILSLLVSDGAKYLRENSELELLNPEISQHTQYKYNEHYRLGDVILVQGKYGTTQKMLVSEYTRTADSNGISGFPTLVRWEEPND